MVGMFRSIKNILKQSAFLVEVVKANRSILSGMKSDLGRMKARSKRRIEMKRYFLVHKIRKLQVGAGYNLLNGWLNTDLQPTSRGCTFLDVTKRFPFENNTFERIFTEHLIEHLTYQDGLLMLSECYRILKLGGRIRIATPNLVNIISLYRHEKTVSQQRYLDWAMKKYFSHLGVCQESFVINNFFRSWGHQFIYDFPTLDSAMKEVGYRDITVHAPGKSDDLDFQGIDFHGKVIGEDINKFETMILEGSK